MGMPNIGGDGHEARYGSRIGTAKTGGRGLGEARCSVGITSDPDKSGMQARPNSKMGMVIKY